MIPGKRYQIEEEVWREMERALEEAKLTRRGSPGKMKDREFIEALLYLQRTGQPWRDLPAEMGYWHAIYMRFRRWEASGVWQRLWKILQAPRFEEARQLFMDSTVIRAHQHAAGAKKKWFGSSPWSFSRRPEYENSCSCS